MFVRSFQLSDYVSVTRLLREVLSETCYEETMEAFAKQLKYDSELVLVAVLNERIVGIIIGTIDNNNGYYYRIAVAKDHQRKGIGKSLIHALKHKFVQRKVKKIMITVDPHNEPILPLYEAVGYGASDYLRAFQRLSIING